MRCLYCGKELALLKRLTGGGEFCSDTHKQSYQDEYNRLALSRLLQAQSKSEDRRTAPKAAPAPAFAAAAAQPAAVAEAEPPIPPEGDFLLEKFGGPEAPELPWLEIAAAPVWDLPPPAPSLAFAGARRDGAPAQASLMTLPKDRCVEAGPSREAFAPAPAREPVSPQAHQPREALRIQPRQGPLAAEALPRAPRLALALAAWPPETGAARLAETVLLPQFDVAVGEAMQAGAAATLIEIPDPNAPVVIPGTSELPGDEPPEPDARPRGALDALTRLQAEILGPGDARPEVEPAQPGHEPETEDPARGRPHRAPTVSFATASPVAAPEMEQVAVAVEEPASIQMAGELLALPVKFAPPPKPRLASFGGIAPAVPETVLPALEAAPLRPKIAIATPPAPAEKRDPAPPAKVAQNGGAAKSGKPKQRAAFPQVRRPAEPESQPKVESRPLSKPESPAKSEARATHAAPPPPAPKAPPPVVASSDVAQNHVPLTLMRANANASFWARLPVAARGGLIAAVLAVGGGLGYLTFSGPRKTVPAAVATPRETAGPSLMMGEGGWATDWAGDSTGLHRGRQITIYKPSLKLSDYRIEFQGKIESNSIGWVFRAGNPENYYAMKLLRSSAGSSRVKLVKYAVIKGKETASGEATVPATPANEVYSVRVDVRGPKFTTYIQGQRADEWNDGRLAAGGVGFLNDRGDRAQIKAVSISYLAGPQN